MGMRIDVRSAEAEPTSTETTEPMEPFCTARTPTVSVVWASSASVQVSSSTNIVAPVRVRVCRRMWDGSPPSYVCIAANRAGAAPNVWVKVTS